MSYLLEALGRGLVKNLRTALENQLPQVPDDTIEKLEQRVRMSPTSLDLALRLGVAYVQDARLNSARVMFEQAHDLDQSAGGPFIGSACACDELGRVDLALENLEQARRRDAKDPALLFGIGFCHERLGNPEAACEAYRAATVACPQLRNAYERLAAIAIRRNDLDDAAAQYETLADMEPGDLDVLLTLGNLYLELQRPADAIGQYQRALLIEPDGGDESLNQADALAEVGKLEEAINKVELLVRKYPGIAAFHVRLGDLYVKSGDDERATGAYQTALSTQPAFLEATVKLGTQHMRQGRHVDAALTFNRAVELNDRLLTAFVGLGVAQHECGRVNEALATFDLAAGLEPSTTLLYSETNRLQLQTERLQPNWETEPAQVAGVTETDMFLGEAIRRHQQGILSCPNRADLHYRHGLLLRQLGHFEDALESFKAALAINRNYAQAAIKLAIGLKEFGRSDEAVNTFRDALRLDQRSVDLHYQLGLLFVQRSQFDLAAEEFASSFAGDLRNIAFDDNLMLALQNVGLVDRAAATWNAICDLGFDYKQIMTQREEVLRTIDLD